MAGFMLYVRNAMDAVNPFEMGVSDTVGDLREKVAEREGIAASDTVLEFQGVRLKDDMIQLADTGITAQCTVVCHADSLVLALRAASLSQYSGKNIAEAASLGAWLDVVRLAEGGCDMDARYDFGYTVLMYLAGTPFVEERLTQADAKVAARLMEWLIKKGAQVKSGDHNNKTALHVWGKYGGSMEQGEVLVKHGADVNHEMKGGYTPLWYVRNYKRPALSGTAGSEAAESNRKRGEGLGGELYQLADAFLQSKGAHCKPKLS
eukprot:Hpha_TRINITY_DN16283_c6_g3::TRINITY_DN16283_c6_g3_i1::g.16351::m.16351